MHEAYLVYKYTRIIYIFFHNSQNTPRGQVSQNAVKIDTHVQKPILR